jgi:hypothetical protein
MTLVATSSGQQPYTLVGHKGKCLSLQFHPHQNALVTSDTSGNLLWWKIFDASAPVNTGVAALPRHPIRDGGHCRAVLSVAWNEDYGCYCAAPDGVVVADPNSGSAPRLVAQTDSVQNGLHFDRLTGAAYSVGDNGLVHILKHKSWVDSFRASKWPLTSVTSFGNYLFVGGVDGSIRIFDHRRSTQPLRSWIAHNDVVQSIDLSPETKRLSTKGADGAICVWNSAQWMALGGLGDSADVDAAPELERVIPCPSSQLKTLSHCRWGGEDWLVAAQQASVGCFSFPSSSAAPVAIPLGSFDAGVVTRVDLSAKIECVAAAGSNGLCALFPFKFSG